MTTFITKGFKDKDLLEKASLPALWVGPAMDPEHRTSSPESKSKYLGERNCTKDVDLFFYCYNVCVKESGKSSKEICPPSVCRNKWCGVPSGAASPSASVLPHGRVSEPPRARRGLRASPLWQALSLPGEV